MPRRFPKPQRHRTDLDLIAVLNLQSRKLCLSSFSVNDLSAGSRGQFNMAAHKIGMRVSLDDVFDLLPVGRRFENVLLDIPLRIDNRCLAVRAEIIRRMRETAEIELLEIHCRTGAPASFQSFQTPAIEWTLV